MLVEDIATLSGERTLFIGSPLHAHPEINDIGILPENLLLLDLNVFNYIRQRKHKEAIHKLLFWAVGHEAHVNAILAASEQHRTHTNPQNAFREYISRLQDDYSLKIDDHEVDNTLKAFQQHQPDLNKNAIIIRNYLIIIKHFFNKSLTLEQKIAQLSKIMIEKDLPIFTFAYKIACIYFLSKEIKNDLDSRLVSKIQSDMAISTKCENESKSLLNVTADIMYFIDCISLFYNKYQNKFYIPYLASADITMKYILSEICYAKVTVSREGHCYGEVGFRPNGFAAKHIIDLIKKYHPVPQGHQYNKIKNSAKIKNLEAVAKELDKKLVLTN